MTIDDAGLLDRLVKTAFEYGPFLFGLLVLVFITKRADQRYKEIAERKEPPPTKDELKARRFAYYASWLAGFLLVGVSVVWWILDRPPQRKDFVRFSIIQLEDGSEHLTPRCDDLYVRTVFAKGTTDYEGDQDLAADHYFLVPIVGAGRSDHVIWINYVNEDVPIQYNFGLNATEINGKTYEVVLDAEGARLKEVSVGDGTSL